MSDQFIGICKKLFMVCQSRSYLCVRLSILSETMTTPVRIAGISTEIQTELKPKALSLLSLFDYVVIPIYSKDNVARLKKRIVSIGIPGY